MIQESVCPICGGESLRRKFTIRSYSILECRACRGYSIRALAESNSATTSAKYQGDYLQRGRGSSSLTGYFDYEGELPLHLRNFYKYLSVVRRYAPGPDLLDVGCSSGHFLLAASRAGFRAKGMDVSEDATDRARSRGFEVWTGDPMTIEMTERFDVITLWETIEHIPDPAALLARLLTWLKPAGVVVIGTGDNAAPLSRLLGSRWWYLVPPDHCVYYNASALRLVLRRSGYVVDRVERAWSHWVGLRNVIMKLLRSFQMPASRVLALAGRAPNVPVLVPHGTTIVAVAHAAPETSR